MATTVSRQPSEPETAVTLRGTQRGLEVEIPPGTEAGAIVAALREKLGESPQFFAGNDVILRFLGEVVTGSLGPLETLCREFDLAIIGIHSPREERRKVARAALAVVDELAEKSAPVIKPPPLVPAPDSRSELPERPDLHHDLPALAPRRASGTGKNAATPTLHPPPAGGGFSLAPAAPRLEPPDPLSNLRAETAPTPTPAPAPMPALAPMPAPAPRPTLTPPPRARFVRGPIRSGSVLESHEHLVILGDVNPGAEIRSLGSITVLGRLRGVAHAGAGHPDGSAGFILALELAPQQLRLGDLVARAGDADNPPGRTEIAYAKDQQIIVETYRGALPRPLWGLVS